MNHFHRSLRISSLLVVSVGAFAQKQAPARPKITGIDHVVFYTTSVEANRHLYTDVLGIGVRIPIEDKQTQRFVIGPGLPAGQWVAYSPAPDRNSNNHMDHFAFRTDNIEALRTYLAAHDVQAPNSIGSLQDGTRSLRFKDPEGHEIEFVQSAKEPLGEVDSTGLMADPVSRHIIHVGFIVHDRAAEDHFYKDILGFHLYWQGGMQNDRADWVAMQVPDGTDWVEYMLNVKPDADQRLTGVMNHVSLGVRDIKAAQAKLEARGWKPNDREHAQMGRDGKWQLNLYDPDQTRIELMEFTPAEKPCCSEFQGQHPSE